MSSAPKLFISYSWSTSEHEQWVVDLASELVSSGVDVILDKWALREGHDSIAFMEKMVTDQSITKVVLICDRAYSVKADGRESGVGTETQIISAEVYAKKAQDKFVAVIAEKDESGKPFLPTYYKSRIYIDLSESDRYAENFEKLLRWIFDKPLYIKPEIGSPPSFITDSSMPILGTSALAKRVIEGLKNDKAYTRGTLDEYLTLFSANLERFRTTSNGGPTVDEEIIKSIEDFLPSRGEFLHVITTLTQYSDVTSHIQRLHRFFESLINYFSIPSEKSPRYETDADNFKFIVHELFLYTVAVLLQAEKYDATIYLLSQPYYLFERAKRGSHVSSSYTAIREYMKSLEIRNHRLQLRRLSIRADLLEQRSKISGLPFSHVMQADFVCFFRAEMMGNTYDRWWPETLLFANRQYGAFEIFARSASKSNLSTLLKLIGAENLQAVKTKLEHFERNRNSVPHWQFESFNPSRLIGAEELGTID